MADKQPREGPGEKLTRLPDSHRTGPERMRKNPAPANGAGTSDPGAWHNGDAPAARAAASGGGSSVLASDEYFSIARRSNPERLLLGGELDICSAPTLTAALAHAAGSTGALHLDLADVHFCDLAALQAIISLTRVNDHQRPARQVVLHHLPAQVEKILRITDWDTLPGLTIDTDETALPASA